ncbi:hypothetical protein I79_014429 [Cricetulus griseus]|uniref:Uncharacterized protein n=1 Tax=Cricetulus griseus TaxID=10029 RepID=G3HU26_CRIGR|nr:hypothetical protein I79_014429 [Cricetulus griseus]
MRPEGGLELWAWLPPLHARPLNKTGVGSCYAGTYLSGVRQLPEGPTGNTKLWPPPIHLPQSTCVPQATS